MSKQAVEALLTDRPIAYHPTFAKRLGDVCCAVFLSQLYYWWGRGRDSEGWIYKTQSDFYEETGLSRRNQETARKKLREAGILEEERKGIPAKMYFRINPDAIIALLSDEKTANTGEQTRMYDSDILDCTVRADSDGATRQTITETTTETTTHKKKGPSEIEKPEPTTTPEQDITAIAERLFADRSKFASKTRKMTDAQIKAHCQRAAEYLYDHTHNKYQRPEFAIEAYKSEPNKAARWANQSWRFTEPKQQQTTYQPPAKKSAGRLRVVRETKFD